MKSKYANQGTQYPRSSVLDILRTLGEYFYRRGQVYQASERLIPLNPREALREHGRLVILGSPGAGKSTLLRYLAREAAKDPNSPVPVLIRLRDYATALSQDRTLALRDFALREVAGGDKQLDWVLEEEAKESRVLWLIDGLDETRGWQERTSHQANQLPGRLVVTSRPVGYQQIGLESLSHFEILPLIPEDVDQFLHDWFGVLAEQRGTNSDWVGERIAWLKKQIEQRPRIQPLTRNPLLLTFMVILAGEDHELPAQRAALYRRYVDDLLDSWELYRRPQGGPEGKSTFALGSLTGNDARRAARQGFYYLGWHLHLTYYGGHGEDNRFNRHTPEGALADYYLNNRDRHLSVNESQALASEVLEFWLEAGILDIWRIEGEEYLAFRHMTFQEYAAACMLASAWEKNPQSVWRETLCPILHHYAWREPIFLLAGLLDPSHFNGLVRRLLGDTSKYERYLHRDLRLAAAFIGESGIGAEGASSRGFDFVDPRLTKKILSGLRWLILYRGSAIWKQKVTLWAAYFLGVMTIWSTLSSWWLCSAELLWTVAWLFAFLKPLLPRIQVILGLPARMWWRTFEPELFIQALGQIQDPQAIDLLIQALGDPDWRIREAVAEALRQIQDPQAIDLLIQGLSDSSEWVRRAAAEALGQTRDPRAVDLLIRALNDSSGIVRKAAGRVLGQIQDPRVVDLLTQILKSPEWQVREAAIEALGQTQDPRVVNPLLRTLRDSSEGVRMTTAKALGHAQDLRQLKIY